LSGNILDIQDLWAIFPQLEKTVQAVRGCSLSISKREILGLVGESGCGKSTLGFACLGMVAAPGQVSGVVKVAGKQITGRSDAELEYFRGGTAAMIFQEPKKALSPFFTVGRQMIDVIIRHRTIDRVGARKAAITAMRTVYLPDPALVLDKYPHQLSGGQLQRIIIAMALACEPKLLIADEPTSALDVTVQAQIIVLLRDLAKAKGLTILFITHDLGVVAALCDKMAVMYAGMVVESGPVKSVLERPSHPYTKKLLATIPKRGEGKMKQNPIRGQVPDMAFPPAGCAFHMRCDEVKEICNLQIPSLQDVGEKHMVACHHITSTSRVVSIDRLKAEQ
jgi:oligopeptide/dipeptide ABC transporter ATP-binding protein